MSRRTRASEIHPPSAHVRRAGATTRLGCGVDRAADRLRYNGFPQRIADLHGRVYTGDARGMQRRSVLMPACGDSKSCAEERDTARRRKRRDVDWCRIVGDQTPEGKSLSQRRLIRRDGQRPFKSTK